MNWCAWTGTAIVTTVLLGVLGGVVRSLVGILKYMERNRSAQKLRMGYLCFSLFVSALIGGLAGALCKGDWRLAAIAGYAGSDFIESLYKIKKSQGLET